MRESTIFRILGALAGTAQDAAGVFAAIVGAGYGASRSTLERGISQTSRRRAKREREFRLWKSYRAALLRLKDDGLLEVRKVRGEKFFSITRRGRERLAVLKTLQKKELPHATFQKEIGDTFLIVAFDIPERERRKRRWLRLALRQLGMDMVQKSVWIGKVKLPEEFLGSLHHLGLMGYVEIFAISKAGTLKHLA